MPIIEKRKIEKKLEDYIIKSNTFTKEFSNAKTEDERLFLLNDEIDTEMGDLDIDKGTN